MGNLEDLPLEALLRMAQEIGAIDRWESAEGGEFVFELTTMRIAIEESAAKAFVRGLLRGFERAATRQKSDEANGADR